MRLGDRETSATSDARARVTGDAVATKMIGKILVVEDEPLVRKTLLRRLSRFGHEAVAVSDGAEAIALLST